MSDCDWCIHEELDGPVEFDFGPQQYICKILSSRKKNNFPLDSFGLCSDYQDKDNREFVYVECPYCSSIRREFEPYGELSNCTKCHERFTMNWQYNINAINEMRQSYVNIMTDLVNAGRIDDANKYEEENKEFLERLSKYEPQARQHRTEEVLKAERNKLLARFPSLKQYPKLTNFILNVIGVIQITIIISVVAIVLYFFYVNFK